MTMIENLVQQFPVRKTRKQKQAFRTWFAGQALDMGYQAVPDEKGFNRNVVIGDPETAQVTFTAHYDTPPRLFVPNICTPANIKIYILYQLLICLVMFGIAGVAGWLGFLVSGSRLVGFDAGYVVLLCICGMMMFGPANPHCVNDNTSGVAAVMEIMNRLPEDQRKKAAFILFDNEEKGLLGSYVYANKHRQVKQHQLIVNMDCVGDGEHMLILANAKARALPAYALLKEAAEQQEFHTVMLDREKCVYPSDQSNFSYGVAICACNEHPKYGYYLDKIHTPKDLVCRQSNLDYLAESMTAFVEKM